MKSALVAVVVATITSAASSAAAQHAIDAAGLTIVFPGFDGGGFAPTPEATQLDSDEWMVWGIDGAPTFGGTCTTGACARGRFSGLLTGLEAGVYGVPPVGGFVTTPGVGLQSGLLGGALRPGGLRFRFQNAEAFPLRTALLRVRWASNNVARIPNPIVAHFDPGCDRSRDVPIVREASGSSASPPWETFDDTYLPFDLNLAPGDTTCIELDLGGGTATGGLGLSAVFEVGIHFPGGVCGNGVIETGEECDAGSTGVDLECGCDTSCHFPHGTPCDAGLGPCVGMCADGACRERIRTDTFPVPGCDDELFCNGVERCVEGACVATETCFVDVCTACDEDLDVCDHDPDCCASDADCDLPCQTGVCNDASRCEVDPTCEPPDASLDGDANVVDDASVRDDGGTTFDGGAGAVSFAGGGGCRCAAIGARSSGGTAIASVFALFVILQRRRRRTRATPHASA